MWPTSINSNINSLRHRFIFYTNWTRVSSQLQDLQNRKVKGALQHAQMTSLAFRIQEPLSSYSVDSGEANIQQSPGEFLPATEEDVCEIQNPFKPCSWRVDVVRHSERYLHRILHWGNTGDWRSTQGLDTKTDEVMRNNDAAWKETYCTSVFLQLAWTLHLKENMHERWSACLGFTIIIF